MSLLNVIEMIPLPSSIESKWLDYLTIRERERFFFIKNQQRKLSFLYGRFLARYTLSERYGLEMAYWKLSSEGPFFVLNAPEPVSISISHSGNFVSCALSVNEIGIDVEKVNKNRPFMSLAKTYFFNGEYQVLQSCEKASDQVNLFYLMWVIKESYAKCYKLTVFDGLKDMQVHCMSGAYAKPSELGFSTEKKGNVFVAFYENYAFSVFQNTTVDICGHFLVLDDFYKMSLYKKINFQKVPQWL